MLQQLIAMQGGQAGEGAAMEAAMPDDLGGGCDGGQDETDKNKANKAMTTEDGQTKAEQRLENVSDITDASMQDLKKSMTVMNQNMSVLINALLGRQGQQPPAARTVQKAQATRSYMPAAQQGDQVLTSLQNIEKVMKSFITRLEEQEAFNTAIMENIGITEEVVRKSLTPAPESNPKPIQNQDVKVFASEFLNVFKSMLEGAGNNQGQGQGQFGHAITKDTPWNERRDVRKNIRGIAEFIHQGANKETSRARGF